MARWSAIAAAAGNAGPMTGARSPPAATRRRNTGPAPLPRPPRPLGRRRPGAAASTSPGCAEGGSLPLRLRHVAQRARILLLGLGRQEAFLQRADAVEAGKQVQVAQRVGPGPRI